MDRQSDVSLYDEEIVEHILDLKPIKPPKEQCSGELFNLKGDKSYPLCGDINGLSYEYWG